jgi:hypothetical protein
VTREFFDSWDIDIQPAATIIHVQRGTEKQICFRNLCLQKDDNLAGSNLHTVRAGWMCCPREPIRSAIPDLIVPFCEQKQNGRPPLFRRASADRIECFADLPASTMFSLCRVEETQQRRRDNCSRFSAKMSVAGRDGFLDRPVVDEWGLAFGQALEALVPGWHPTERRLRSKISHDIDEVGFGKRLWPDHLNTDTGSLARTAWMALPFDLRHAIRLCLADQSPIAGGAHLLRTLVLGQPSCLDLIDYLVGEAHLRGLSPAIYWKASHLGPYDSGYDLRHKKIRNLIYGLRERGVEQGVHPGYGTYLRQAVLEAELRILRDVLQEPQLGGRQHYLRWCPETWRDWENAGLCYDSSVGYADQAGFRAGTSIPYRPWQLSCNREARLLEIPLVVMDVTLLNYMLLRGDALLDSVRQLLERCRLVGGVFTFLCHNTTLRDTNFAGAYGQILDMLASTAQFDWKSNLANEWC